MESNVSYIEQNSQVILHSNKLSDDSYNSMSVISNFLLLSISSSYIKNLSLLSQEFLGKERTIREKDIQIFKLVPYYNIKILWKFFYVFQTKKKIKINLQNKEKVQKHLEMFIFILIYSNCITLQKEKKDNINDNTKYQKIILEHTNLLCMLIVKLCESNLIDYPQCEMIIKFYINLSEYAFTTINFDFNMKKESYIKALNLIIKLIQANKDEKEEEVITQINLFIVNMVNFYIKKILPSQHLYFSLNRNRSLLGFLNLGKFTIITKDTNKLIIDFLTKLYSFTFTQIHIAAFITGIKSAFIHKPIINRSYFSQIINYLILLNSLANQKNNFSPTLIKEGFIFNDEYKNQNEIIIKNLNIAKDFTFVFAFNYIKTKKNMLYTLFSLVENNNKNVIFNIYLNQNNQLGINLLSKEGLKTIIIESFDFKENNDYIMYMQIENRKTITIYINDIKIFDYKGRKLNFDNISVYIGVTVSKGENCNRFNGIFGNLLIFNEKLKDSLREFIIKQKFYYYLLSEIGYKSIEYETFISSKEYLNIIKNIRKYLKKNNDISIVSSSIQFVLSSNLAFDIDKGKTNFKIKNSKIKYKKNAMYPVVIFPSTPIVENCLVFPFKQLNFYDEFIYYEGFSFLLMVLEFYYNTIYQNKNIDNIQEMFNGIGQICDLLIKIIKFCKVYNNFNNNIERVFFSLGKFIYLVRKIYIIFILVNIGKNLVLKL